jgi:hypothetical protein
MVAGVYFSHLNRNLFEQEEKMLETFRMKKDLWPNILKLSLLFSLFYYSFLAYQVYRWLSNLTKPIQIIITFPPGGGSDVFARLINNKLSDLLGQPVLIVNKPGGSGVIGTYYALNSPLTAIQYFSSAPYAFGL